MGSVRLAVASGDTKAAGGLAGWRAGQLHAIGWHGEAGGLASCMQLAGTMTSCRGKGGGGALASREHGGEAAQLRVMQHQIHFCGVRYIINHIIDFLNLIRCYTFGASQILEISNTICIVPGRFSMPRACAHASLYKKTVFAPLSR